MPSTPVTGQLNQIKQRKVTLSAAEKGTGYFQGLLEYLPADYDENEASGYPVIIYFHGLNGWGNGSSIGTSNTTSQLCKILTDASGVPGYSLPLIIERGTRGANLPFPTTVTDDDDNSFSYIVISPQFPVYNYTQDRYPGANAVDSVIKYVKEHYNIDESRIYLTGLSTGANMVMEYVGSTLARAKSVAAVAVASLCSNIGPRPAPLTGNQNLQAPEFIAAAKLPVYMLHCPTDVTCDIDIPRKWRDDINAIPGAVPAILYELGTTSASPYTCEDITEPLGNNHNTWYHLYNPTFPVGSYNNVYNWMINQVNLNALPVTLKDYSARLTNGKVYVRWTTTSETNNKEFTIERAGADQRFSPIGKVAGSGNSNLENKYEFVDQQPLSNISYYRLVQTDIDGKREVFEMKQVVNQAGNKSKVIVSPNPFSNELKVFVSLNKSQKVSLHLTDMSGRKVASQSGVYAEGTPINVNIANLRSGVYFVKIESEGVSETVRVVKR